MNNQWAVRREIGKPEHRHLQNHQQRDLLNMLGSDFSLDINYQEQPKVFCLTNNTRRIMIYGAVLSSFITRMLKSDEM